MLIFNIDACAKKCILVIAHGTDFSRNGVYLRVNEYLDKVGNKALHQNPSFGVARWGSLREKSRFSPLNDSTKAQRSPVV